MPGISSLGMGSGIDLGSILDKIMQAEAAPLAQLDGREKEETNKITELGKLKNLLADLSDAAEQMGDPAKLSVTSASSSDNDVLSVSSTEDALEDAFDITVKQLATAAKIRSTGYEKKSSVIGEGKITITMGTYDGDKKSFSANPEEAPVTITINKNQSSLEGIRDAINQANAHVHASIIFDGSDQGTHLVITADETGEKHQIKISVTPPAGQENTGLKNLEYDPSAPDKSTMSVSQTPKDAIIELDGLTIHSDSNTLDKQIPGVTLTLKKASEEKKSVHVSVTKDNSKSRQLLDSFVSAYNKLIKGLNAAKQKDSILNGTTSVNTVQRSISDILNTFIETGKDNIQYLSSLGVHADEDGQLSIHDDEFTKAMETKNFSIKDFFMGRTQSSSKNVIIEKTNDKKKSINKDDEDSIPDLDTHQFHLDVIRPAQDARIEGSLTTEAVTIDDSNHSLTINNNNNITQITIPNGHYTPEQLTQMINGLLHGQTGTAQTTLSVEKNAKGINHYVMHNHQYGHNSKMSISGSATHSLFGNMSTTAGQDVQINIDGSIRTGDGQEVSVNGLQLKITSEEPEANISITKSSGFQDIAGRILSRENGKNGALSTSINSLNDQIKDVEKQKERLSDELNNLKQRYQKQFQELDSYISKMNQTSNFLKSALR